MCLGSGTLVPFKVLPLWPHTCTPVLLCKTVCKLLFWDHHYLSHCVLSTIHDHKLPFQWQFWLWEKTEVVWRLPHLGYAMFCRKKQQTILHMTWRMSRCVVMMKSPLAHSCAHFLLRASLGWQRTLMFRLCMPSLDMETRGSSPVINFLKNLGSLLTVSSTSCTISAWNSFWTCDKGPHNEFCHHVSYLDPQSSLWNPHIIF